MFQQINKAPSYMQELDSWIQKRVIDPLSKAVFDYHTASPLPSGDEDELETTVADVKRAIREKVLESYHNGQAAEKSVPATAHRSPRVL